MGEEGKKIIRLDGSHGMGIDAHLTIITADRVNGKKETTYQFPYVLIDFVKLQMHVDGGFILGYAIEKILQPTDGTTILQIGSDGISRGYEPGEGQ